MKLNLKKPLIVFDLETTGLDMVKDRIIQISYIKVSPDGTETRKNLFVNPEKEIPAEVVALTGINIALDKCLHSIVILLFIYKLQQFII